LRLWGVSEKAKILHRTEVINALIDIFSFTANTVNICGNSKLILPVLSLEITKKTILASATKKQPYKAKISL
jgi:hypothetical protein